MRDVLSGSGVSGKMTSIPATAGDAAYLACRKGRMNESALPVTKTIETPWSEPDLDQSVSQELHGRTEQPLTWRTFIWRAVGFGVNLGLFILLFQLYKVGRKTFI